MSLIISSSCKIFSLNGAPQAIPAEFGVTIDPKPVTDNVIEVYLVTRTTKGSIFLIVLPYSS